MVAPWWPAAPSSAVHGWVLVPAVKPNRAKLSPWWKLTMVLQVDAPPRPSTKKVSAPPSSTLVPPWTWSASLPVPPRRNTLGVAAVIAASAGLAQRYCC